MPDLLPPPVSRWSRCAFSVLIAIALALGCRSSSRTESHDPGADAAAGEQQAAPAAPQPDPSQPAQADDAAVPEQPGALVLIAGGDIDLSRGTGQKILRDPSWDPFYDVRPLLQKADVRFANLESPLSDQNGVTGSKENQLVFTGPPGGAEVLTRGGFDVVSTANNHAWDYGKRGLRETLDNLDRVGIAHVGTSRTAESPIGPLLMERKGHKLAWFAMTAIFNDGPANLPEPRKYVAAANVGVLQRAIASVRDQVDWVVVSTHMGQEYADEPVGVYRAIMTAVVDAGADVVLGHHTHTPQRIEFYKGVPMVYSMGNFVFHQHRDHPWTGFGYLARVTLQKGSRAALEICPYHLLSSVPHPVTPGQEKAFLHHLKRISMSPQAGRAVTRSDDGCWSIEGAAEKELATRVQN